MVEVHHRHLSINHKIHQGVPPVYPAFRKCNPEGRDLDISEEKDYDQPVRDLHIERPRRWNLSIHSETYGVRETFLSLLSGTVRLANKWRILKFHLIVVWLPRVDLLTIPNGWRE